ncbi:hypothetical protein EMCRGX_G012810 [Ephydatia muelleri]
MKEKVVEAVKRAAYLISHLEKTQSNGKPDPLSHWAVQDITYLGGLNSSTVGRCSMGYVPPAQIGDLRDKENTDSCESWVWVRLVGRRNGMET